MENHTTALDSSYNHSSNISYPVYDTNDYGDDPEGSNTDLFCWLDNNDRGVLLSKIVIGIFFPMSLLAIYSLYAQIRSERAVPVFIINLLISDILQVTCKVVKLAYGMHRMTDVIAFIYTYFGFVIASVFFMTLIALERYVMIAHPLWYRFNKTTKVFVSVSIVTWILSILMGFVIAFNIISTVLLPLPFMIFFIVGTFRALSTAQAVPAAEKRRIVAVLVVVVLIYSVMFLPIVSWNFSCMLIQISPLTDMFLYIFLKKWFIDKLLTSLCCCIKDSDEA
ncbi:ovarian cancer G-protein coupled receptor 1-like [Cyprinodon tularosa]|uniref:ovarian cancer G-protein coupled receptor 1-like n=1 Tax=Cyprinodon tularosa TaxID=77115 RepID=UPI0018E1E4B4|nr:ovarian cancer G-protein coupled receptor 1-like [Cyprinodon tularosa]